MANKLTRIRVAFREGRAQETNFTQKFRELNPDRLIILVNLTEDGNLEYAIRNYEEHEDQPVHVGAKILFQIRDALSRFDVPLEDILGEDLAERVNDHLVAYGHI